jgi:hypothetical protein
MLSASATLKLAAPREPILFLFVPSSIIFFIRTYKQETIFDGEKINC